MDEWSWWMYGSFRNGYAIVNNDLFQLTNPYAVFPLCVCASMRDSNWFCLSFVFSISSMYHKNVIIIEYRFFLVFLFPFATIDVVNVISFTFILN